MRLMQNVVEAILTCILTFICNIGLITSNMPPHAFASYKYKPYLRKVFQGSKYKTEKVNNAKGKYYTLNGKCFIVVLEDISGNSVCRS